MKLPIAYYGDPILRKKAKPVEKITDEIRQFVEDMIETVESLNGLGLAAPQVKSSLRIFIICIFKEDEEGNLERGTPEVFINPKLSLPSDEKNEFSEGCLSIPGISETVTRPSSITVEAMNLDGEIFTRRLTGMDARVVMHENDHLNGVVFVDRVQGKRRQNIDPVLRDLKKRFSAGLLPKGKENSAEQ